MDKQTENHPDSAAIDMMGGTSSVAKLCRVKPPSVSEWRKTGIPSARRQYLELVHPDAFDQEASPPNTLKVA